MCTHTQHHHSKYEEKVKKCLSKFKQQYAAAISKAKDYVKKVNQALRTNFIVNPRVHNKRECVSNEALPCIALHQMSFEKYNVTSCMKRVINNDNLIISARGK